MRPHFLVEKGGWEALDELPRSLAPGLRRYVEDGLEPGGLLCAIIDNDLAMAMARCGDPQHVRDVCAWLNNFATATCWGSREKREAWIARAFDENVERARAFKLDAPAPPKPVSRMAGGLDFE